MNPEAILALISDLYTQIRQLQEELAEVRRENLKLKAERTGVYPEQKEE